jgi:Ca2+-binding EF-hand superfamily protein
MNEELLQTYEALTVILTDESQFTKVIKEIFKTFDIDGSGTISLDEIKKFMNGTSLKMDDNTFREVFAELDEDGTNDVSQEELGRFMRRLFRCQRDEIGKVIGIENK